MTDAMNCTAFGLISAIIALVGFAVGISLMVLVGYQIGRMFGWDDPTAGLAGSERRREGGDEEGAVVIPAALVEAAERLTVDDLIRPDLRSATSSTGRRPRALCLRALPRGLSRRGARRSTGSR